MTVETNSSENVPQSKGAFVHLAYIDDSGSNERCPCVLFGALLVRDTAFHQLESVTSLTAGLLLGDESRIDQFDEFHAYDLFHGKGAFEGIEEERRHDIIKFLLGQVAGNNIRFIYSAVDRAELRKSPFDSANAIDIAFRMCLLGLENHIVTVLPRVPTSDGLDVTPDTCLFVVDDTENKDLKTRLRKSFRQLRAKWRPTQKFLTQQRLWHAHDDMYFGDSKDSIGLQIADLCAFFTLGRLDGRADQDQFFDLISSQVLCSKPEPEWSRFQSLMRIHHDENTKNETRH